MCESLYFVLGTKVKIKMMKYADIDWDKDLDDESNFGEDLSDLEQADDGDTPLGSQKKVAS